MKRLSEKGVKVVGIHNVILSALLSAGYSATEDVILALRVTEADTQEALDSPGSEPGPEEVLYAKVDPSLVEDVPDDVSSAVEAAEEVTEQMSIQDQEIADAGKDMDEARVRGEVEEAFG